MFISDDKAIYHILQERDRYVCYLGAGASAEAGVMTAQRICEQIRDKLLELSSTPDPNGPKQILEQWENATLNWDDSSRRYSTCIKEGYSTPDQRVQYFRKILKNARPSFCHHAVALLMRNHYFKNTCLTTNFDKLLESAITQQQEVECQPIRTTEESRFWQQEPDKYYIIKLHGDYDTYNILNTRRETVEMDKSMQSIVESLLQSAGMVVIGTAGYEKSIDKLFDSLALQTADTHKVLSFGLLWGVYMNQPKPRTITADELERLIMERIKQGEVSQNIHEMIKSTNREKNDLFCFFPVWGAGIFLFDLINATHDKALVTEADLYLDHEMRLRNVFTGAGLSEERINKHIEKLKKSQERLKQSKDSISPKSGGDGQKPDLVFEIHGKSTEIAIRVMYGDITSRSFMAHEDFQSSIRAILSPEDTCLTAGGGVAYALLNKAGKYNILNELAKFSPIEQGTIAVTSGGKLPVHFIFHAAAIKIEENADSDYSVTKDSVRQTMKAALEKAFALEVSTLLVPLMGSGVADFKHKESLEAILEAISEWNEENHKMTIIIFVYMEKDLPRHAIHQCIKEKLDSRFHIPEFS